jgi:hypothetical protein
MVVKYYVLNNAKSNPEPKTKRGPVKTGLDFWIGLSCCFYCSFSFLILKDKKRREEEREQSPYHRRVGDRKNVKKLDFGLMP